MLLQTNSYIVPKDKRADHARLLRRFRQTLQRLGCDHFECYEQVGPNWTNGESTGRFVQIMRFRDRRHQLSVQQAERADPIAQQVIGEFCEMVNFPYQQQQGLFAVGFYTSVLPMSTRSYRGPEEEEPANEEGEEAQPAPTDEQPMPVPQPGEMPATEEAAPESDGQPPDEASTEALDISELPGEAIEPNAADEAIDAEAAGERNSHRQGFASPYPQTEDESDPDAEARRESEPFSR